MNYQLFSDLDYNFGIHFYDENGSDFMITEHPKTKTKMTRNEALELAEAMANPKEPKTKLEFFEILTTDDYVNYLSAASIVSNKFKTMEEDNEEYEDIKQFKVMLTRFEMLPDLTFNDQDVLIMRKFCKTFDISAFKRV